MKRASAMQRGSAAQRASSTKRAGGAQRASAAGACAKPPHEQLIKHRRWLSRVQITEYYPAPERWFSGRKVKAPGLPGRHRADFLYSARGVSMEGDGVDLSGRKVHIHDLGNVGWVNAAGRATRPGRCAAHWSRGIPYWRAGGWRNSNGAVTFPFQVGGWSQGAGRWRGGYGGTSFAPGASLRLRYYHSVAVDPRLIPRGSRIFIPAYRDHGGGWFLAQDTGGAIIGRHLDVYRSPPSNPADRGQFLTDQRVYVIPPGG
jgi:3D (Asp-Asp-Asp) domain-containing protein